MNEYLMGIDVGTGSARAGVFNAQGHLLGMAARSITMWNSQPGRSSTGARAEQSSENIWRAVCECAREAVANAKIAPEGVVGVGFDATCSLVALNRDLQPMAVNEESEDERNVIVWMDQRAVAEAREINAGDYQVLQYVGGKISPEMETPKLLWLKRHLPETFQNAGKFFDLADYLTWRATGVEARSQCTMVCKWTYLGHENRFDDDYFLSLGLQSIFDRSSAPDGQVSRDVRPPGQKLGALTEESARELGLTTNCAVGVGLIDAHAGGLGALGGAENLESALALIGGTSNCHMSVTRERVNVPGVWGPYWGAMVPEMWLLEGGQTTAGSAIDYFIAQHPHFPDLQADAQNQNRTIYELLNDEVARLQQAANVGPQLTRDLHVLPDLLGNRSPRANPNARGLIDGLTLDNSRASHALLYYAALQSVAYGTREIIAAMNQRKGEQNSAQINTLFATGGGIKNPLWLQEHADATGCVVVVPECSEAVLLGSAILGALAANVFPDATTAMRAMSRAGKKVTPRPAFASYHDAKFTLFRELAAQQNARHEAMSGF